jgi:methanogenic corrinoid protein MtbC1
MPAPGIVDLTPIVEALDRYDLAAIEAMLSSYGVVLTPHGLVFSVVLPLLREVGNRWAAGTLRPAQEHLVSAIVRSVLGALLRANARHDALPKIVFATPAGERHELGLLCAALIAAAKGYGVVYLGPDLPSADIWHATAKSDARVVILSLTASGSVPKTELRTINKPPTGVEVWVGGPAADSLLTMAGSSTRRIDDLEGLVTLLDTHAR